MDKIIQFITEKAFNETIALLFFIGGVILGGIAVYVIYRLFALKKREKKSANGVKDVTPIKNEAISYFTACDEGFNEKKLTSLLTASSIILSEIPKEYNKNTKLRRILNAEDVKFLEEDLKISLDFTVYEAIYFLREFLEELQAEILKFLNAKPVKLVYGVGKIVNAFTVKQEITKNAEDLKLSQVIEIIKRLKPDPQKKKGVIGSLVGKALNKIKPIALDKTVDVLEPYCVEILEILADKINLLYSGGLPFNGENALVLKEGA
ncbi:MAG: hypothetical protein E7360_05660 [Clostridiales bacterium]|nr:hypothetical protein [Clostridiales bacterium]